MTRSKTLAPHPDLPRYYAGARERSDYVQDVFDATAPWYDLSSGMLALGTGDWYRGEALLRAGLRPGMRLLDLATGTGAVASAAHRVAEDLTIVGADVSIGMLREVSRKKIVMPVQTEGESLPFPDRSFDMISVGFALRHFSDLLTTFREMYRVLRPEGRLVILEITPPAGRISRGLLRIYMKRLIPMMARVRSGDRRVQEMLQYYWDTTEACVPPVTILEALREAEFDGVHRHVEAFINSEYTASRAP